MIYITGDVHNRLPAVLDEVHCGVREAKAAIEWARILAEAGVQGTLFVTGKSLHEEPAAFRTLSLFDNIEVGAHGWDSFADHRWRSMLWSLCGSRYGPRRYQSCELSKVLEAFRSVLGMAPIVWRGHAFYADENTYPLLGAAGFRVVSDHVGGTHVAEVAPGLWSVPINTSPDHDTVAHGKITQSVMNSALAIIRAHRELRTDPEMSRGQRGAVLIRRLIKPWCNVGVVHSGEAWYAKRGAFELLSPSGWEAMLYAEIEDRMATVGFATVLLHPVCMSALDGFKSFRRVIQFCRQFESGKISEAPAALAARNTDRESGLSSRCRFDRSKSVNA